MLSACAYQTGRTLGEGSYAVVKEAVIETGERFAAKVISKRLMAGKEDSILNEIDILKRVSKGHRNIVTLHDYFETPNNLYLVMDLCTGGELFDRIVERGSFYEEDAADIVKTILSATAYLHANHVVHRDIKPENILFRSKDSNELVLADFGLSKIANDNESNLKTLVGTYGYIAPEILRQKGYTSSVDIWSIGVIAYFLLSGYTPFNGDNMLQDILDGRYAFQPYEYWVDISQLAQDFITRTVMLDPRKRMSAEDALEHPWILDYAPTQTVATLKRAMTKDLLPEVKSNMIGKDKLRSAVKTVMVSNRLASLTQQAKGNGSRDSGLSAATAVDEKGTVV